jgi:alanine-glyoxylate transaminase / (R)-3-amino-2-methylpropionate-pyruvate transaminase
MDYKTIMSKHGDFLFPSVINYHAEPIAFAKGKGMRLTDVNGVEYLDFFGGILTVSLGHCHEGINAAIIEQMQTLGHTSTLYPNEMIVTMAEKMASILPEGLNRSFFVNSGTEADETAITIAKTHAGGNHDIVALRHCYSGRSTLTMNLCAHAAWRVLPTLVPGIKHAHAPYCYRCAMGLTYPECDLRCARDIEELIQTETCGRIAAFIAEPILGVGGFIVPPKEYFKVATEIIRKYGGIFIADEVQTGFGRTGTHMNGFEHYDVMPDVVTYAKGMANGFPIGCTVATDKVAKSFEGLTICTFGGNPLAMAAALATLEVMQTENIPERSAQRGAQLRAGLDRLAETHKWVGEVRGMGLMLAMELVEDRTTKEPSATKAVALMEAAKAEGLLIGKGGLYGNVLRIAPPMLCDETDIDEGIKKLGKAMAQIN